MQVSTFIVLQTTVYATGSASPKTEQVSILFNCPIVQTTRSAVPNWASVYFEYFSYREIYPKLNKYFFYR